MINIFKYNKISIRTKYYLTSENDCIGLVFG
jgi:hypothetical protein